MLRRSTERRKVRFSMKFNGVLKEQSQRGRTGPYKWFAIGLEMIPGNLQLRTDRRVKITYLIPRPAWPVGF